MRHELAFLVSYLSRRLRSGAVIAADTPPGVGQKPPAYLRAGQTTVLA